MINKDLEMLKSGRYGSVAYALDIVLTISVKFTDTITNGHSIVALGLTLISLESTNHLYFIL